MGFEGGVVCQKSSARPSECPKPDRPEYAFIGRSNVKQSSLLNMLAGRNSLAKTSSTPGKTQLINHFDIDGTWYLGSICRVWLRQGEQKGPGQMDYGHQAISRFADQPDVRYDVGGFTHSSPKVDLEFMAWMGEVGLPFVLVFTKVDKLNKAEREAFLPAYEAIMLKQWHKMPPVFVTSGNTGEAAKRCCGSLRPPMSCISPEGDIHKVQGSITPMRFANSSVNPRRAWAWSLSEVDRS